MGLYPCKHTRKSISASCIHSHLLRLPGRPVALPFHSLAPLHDESIQTHPSHIPFVQMLPGLPGMPTGMPGFPGMQLPRTVEASRASRHHALHNHTRKRERQDRPVEEEKVGMGCSLVFLCNNSPIWERLEDPALRALCWC